MDMLTQSSSMPYSLGTKDLAPAIDTNALGFADTSQLTSQSSKSSWIGQAPAEKAARFGLSLQQPGFHLLVLGEPGSGRTSLMRQAMQQAAALQPVAPDVVYLNNFETPQKPLALHLIAGAGAELRTALDRLVRHLARAIPILLQEFLPRLPEAAQNVSLDQETNQALAALLDEQLDRLKQELRAEVLDRADFSAYLAALRQDALENLALARSASGNDMEDALDSILARYRANLLVDNRHQQGAPVVYDDDPTLLSLFGGIEAAGESSGPSPDYMRLRAGNLLRASGGMLMLHLRDLLADAQNGNQILEKLQRYLRNGSVQIEEAAGAPNHGVISHIAPDPLVARVKLVLIATRDDYYRLYDETPDFFDYFRIMADFAESFAVDAAACQAVATYIGMRCKQFGLPHCDASAVALMLRTMQRWVEDRTRFSADFGRLQALILESAAMAAQRQAELISAADVEAALAARHARHQYGEQQLCDAIIEGDLAISVLGHAVGQINGMSHIDHGDASFGSPVRISARCYAGDEGIVNIGREVELSGPNHDKGVFILQSWLSASFVKLTPLSLSAALVFEQEYHGVEGDSASCAELYALLSALSGLPLSQGLAVTGALNQHGEVMPVGGLNEKIEGYFRVCRRVGLDGTQGVLIPARNKRHLLLHDEVVQAVAAGKFHIYAITHALEGIALLTGLDAGVEDDYGNYRPETVMGRVQRTLEAFQRSSRGQHRPLGRP